MLSVVVSVVEFENEKTSVAAYVPYDALPAPLITVLTQSTVVVFFLEPASMNEKPL